jgi:hypothetical protein
MGKLTDPTSVICKRAGALRGVVAGTACNQRTYKVGGRSFLFIGPGAKGHGYKAMFKLERSLGQARKLASKDRGRVQVGSTGWVTTRFTAEAPLSKAVWERWLKESYDLLSAADSAVGKSKVGKKC